MDCPYKHRHVYACAQTWEHLHTHSHLHMRMFTNISDTHGDILLGAMRALQC